MMQSAKTSVFDDVSYRNIPNENKKTSGLGHAESAIGCYIYCYFNLTHALYRWDSISNLTQL